MVGGNTDGERREAGRFLLEQLHDSRYSEYAEWLRIMFRLYDGVPRGHRPPGSCAFRHRLRRDGSPAPRPGFRGPRAIVQQHHRLRDQHREQGQGAASCRPCTPQRWISPGPRIPRRGRCSTSTASCGPSAPRISASSRRGTSSRRRNTSLHLEEYFESRHRDRGARSRTRCTGSSWRILRSPKTNPTSRILYVDGFQAQDWRFSRPYSECHGALGDRATTGTVGRREPAAGHRLRGRGDAGGLDDIGREYREAGEPIRRLPPALRRRNALHGLGARDPVHSRVHPPTCPGRVPGVVALSPRTVRIHLRARDPLQRHGQRGQAGGQRVGGTVVALFPPAQDRAHGPRSAQHGAALHRLPAGSRTRGSWR